MIRKEVWELSAEDFFTHIITIICDYAKINGYEITDAVKTIGESLQEITEIATFDNWEINEEALVTDTCVGSKWVPIGQYPAEPSLLCFKSGNMTVGYYDYEYEGWSVLTADGFETDMTDEDMEDGEPIAYRSLPEPYKEE